MTIETLIGSLDQSVYLNSIVDVVGVAPSVTFH